MRTFLHLQNTSYSILTSARRLVTSSPYLQIVEKPGLKLEAKPPDQVHRDWIGPAHPDSNLRPRQYHIPKDETPTEQKFRLLQEETHRWNHNFWAQHNKNFSSSKVRYIQAELTKLGPLLEDGSERRLTPETMSKFYRCFLSENYKQQKQYNKEWYLRNIALLWPAFQVFWIRLWKRR